MLGLGGSSVVGSCSGNLTRLRLRPTKHVSLDPWFGVPHPRGRYNAPSQHIHLCYDRPIEETQKTPGLRSMREPTIDAAP
jgi:hypothetical protein